MMKQLDVLNKKKIKYLKVIRHPTFPMQINIEGCTKEISLLQLLKFIRNAMDKPRVI